VVARAWLVLLLAAAGFIAAVAQPVQTAEQEISETPSSMAIADPIAVFGFVLRNLPERAQVYPTENYYYVRFVHNGTPYAGNIRLAAADRDQGKLHFAYGEQPSDRKPAPSVKHVVLDGSHGIVVAKLSPFAYRVTHEGRAVTFALNDLSQAKPPQGLLWPDERLLGPIFDESAVRFFLVFNSRLKVFHYLLDETAAPADEWEPHGAILIGRRTGFAFYRDGERKILVGVKGSNSRLNNAFDGPFDQLPENFFDGDTFRDAIVAVEPSLKDKVDRLGNLPDGRDRYLVHPYLLYRRVADLAVFHRCMTNRRVREAVRARCFVVPDNEAQKRNPLPLGLERRR
jgi:hypothetical protein